jgi:hypothetical protein
MPFASLVLPAVMPTTMREITAAYQRDPDRSLHSSTPAASDPSQRNAEIELPSSIIPFEVGLSLHLTFGFLSTAVMVLSGLVLANVLAYNRSEGRLHAAQSSEPDLLYTLSPRSLVPKMPRSRLILACFSAVFVSTRAQAQAGLEYAARTAGSVMTNRSGEFSFGSCPLDGSVLTCIQHYYSTAFYIALVGICLVVGYALYPKRRA